MSTANPLNAELAKVVHDFISEGRLKSLEIFDSNSKVNISLTNGDVYHFKHGLCSLITFSSGVQHSFHKNGQLARTYNPDKTGVVYAEDGTVIRELVKFTEGYEWPGYPADKLSDPNTAIIVKHYQDDGSVMLALRDNGFDCHFGKDHADGSSVRYPHSSVENLKAVHFDASGRRVREDDKAGEHCLFEENGDKAFYKKNGVLYGIIKADGTKEHYADNGKLFLRETKEDIANRVSEQRKAVARDLAEAKRPKLVDSFSAAMVVPTGERRKPKDIRGLFPVPNMG